jgi:hypothetical protein
MSKETVALDIFFHSHLFNRYMNKKFFYLGYFSIKIKETNLRSPFWMCSNGQKSSHERSFSFTHTALSFATYGIAYWNVGMLIFCELFEVGGGGRGVSIGYLYFIPSHFSPS